MNLQLVNEAGQALLELHQITSAERAQAPELRQDNVARITVAAAGGHVWLSESDVRQLRDGLSEILSDLIPF